MRAAVLNGFRLGAPLAATAAQIAGVALTVVIAVLANALSFTLSVEICVAVQAVSAAAVAAVLGMAPWWIWIHLAFAPGLMLALALDVPSALAGIAFATLLAIYGAGTLLDRVPLYLTSRHALRALVDVLPAGAFSMIDLGAGNARVLSAIRQQHPRSRLEGVERALLPYVLATLRGLLSGFDVRLGDFWKCDLGSYDVVYAYLSPEPMARLWRKAQREMHTGALFISNEFPVPGAEPTGLVRYGAHPSAVLYLWRM